jgi:hypothetical protein
MKGERGLHVWKLNVDYSRKMHQERKRKQDLLGQKQGKREETKMFYYRNGKHTKARQIR